MKLTLAILLLTSSLAFANNVEVTAEETQQAFDQINDVLAEERMVPNFEDGKTAGYKKVQLEPGSKLDQLGLHEGETITVPAQPAEE